MALASAKSIATCNQGDQPLAEFGLFLVRVDKLQVPRHTSAMVVFLFRYSSLLFKRLSFELRDQK